LWPSHGKRPKNQKHKASYGSIGLAKPVYGGVNGHYADVKLEHSLLNNILEYTIITSYKKAKKLKHTKQSTEFLAITRKRPKN
jgi:hypothetical protein